MGVSKKQKPIVQQCCCGCEEMFNAFPIYSSKRTKQSPENYDVIKGDNGASLYVPKYKRGHHPNTRKTTFGNKPSWNKGLKKSDHPSIHRTGFQPGHKPYNDWSHVIKLQRTDREYRKRWLAAKKGQVPWNKGLKKTLYPNGIKSGPEHGNWCGNKRGVNDLAKMKEIKNKVLKRDNYTCQHCGDRNHKGRGSRIKLEVHHIISIAEDHTLAFVEQNLITLCADCHRATDNYGTKVVEKIRKQGGN